MKSEARFNAALEKTGLILKKRNIQPLTFTYASGEYSLKVSG
jgi:hypothetical protein